MKLTRIWGLLLMFCILGANAQERRIIYEEGFGNADPDKLYMNITDYAGWDREDCLYSGTGRVGFYKSMACDISGSSGERYVYFPDEQYSQLLVEEIEASGFHNFELSFNLKKNKKNSGKLLIEVWMDGNNKKSYTPVLKGAQAWYTIDPIALSVPMGSKMILRFTNKTPDVMIYLDDLKLTAIPDIPDLPVFALKSGLYTEPVTLELTANQGADIYYTLDGSVPDESSQLYQEPIILDQTTTVSAIAITGGKQSEVATERYEIVKVPTVANAQEFRRASERVRLDLVPAEVVDVDDRGIYVHTPKGGLLLPSGALSAGKGDVLGGFLIGKPEDDYGMTRVADGIFSQVTVSPGISSTMPLSVSWDDLLQTPYQYTACLVQLTRMAYLPETGSLISAEADDEKTLRIKTGSWSEEPTWIWPEKMTVNGVLKGDESGLYLWVAEAGQIVDLSVPEPPKAEGTALVVTESDGSYYAAQNMLDEGALPCVRVGVLEGRAIASSQDLSSLQWEFDYEKGYLQTPSGAFLQAASSGTALQMAQKADDYCEWTKNETEGYWMRNTDPKRVLMRVERYNAIKNYAVSNIGNGGYSSVPATDMPLYEGYLRELTPGRWGTVCVPYAVNIGDFSGALFFEVEGRVDDQNGMAKTLVLSEPLERLEAGLPYVIYSESSFLSMLYSGNPVGGPLSRNGLCGTFEGINPDKDVGNTVLEGKYVFSGNLLRKCAVGSSVGANKAFVDLDRVPVLSGIPEGYLRIPIAVESTDMQFPENDSLNREPVYSLQGQYLGLWDDCKQLLPKGIYVLNGKKIVIK